MSYFTTGGPGKEQGTNKPPPTRRIWERSKGERRHQSTCPANLPESSSLESILAERLHAPPERTLSQNDWPETTWKWIPSPQNPRLRATRQSSSPGFPHPAALPRAPLPNKVSCFVSTWVSSDNSFPSVRQEPTPGPWKGSPSCNRSFRSLSPLSDLPLLLESLGWHLGFGTKTSTSNGSSVRGTVGS